MSRGTENAVILIGNVGQDPESRVTPNGTTIANLNLATDDSYKDRQTGQLVPQTDWHRIVLIGKVAEVARDYVRKGHKLYVMGKLKTRKWQGQDGQDRYTTEVVVDMNGKMTMLSGDGNGQQGASRSTAPANQPAQSQGQNQQQQGKGKSEPVPAGDPNYDDDYPF